MNYEEIKAAWNAQADEYNQWGELSEVEKIEWAAIHATAKARAALEVRVPPGWKLVPIEPTEDQLWCLYGRFVGQLTTEAKLYSDMLAAAPPAPDLVITEREECTSSHSTSLSNEQIETLLRSWPEDSIAFFDFARAIEEARAITQGTTQK